MEGGYRRLVAILMTRGEVRELVEMSHVHL